jgi:glycerol kinase
MSHILALDQGTSSSRAIIFDADGGIVAAAQRPFEQIFPRPGWVEHDPRQIWETQLGTAREALAQAGLGAGDIAAIGIANQRETVVIWDRQTGEPIHNAIVWQDRRTADIIARLRSDGHEATVREKTGLILDPYFSGAKISWLLDHVPEARSRAERGQLAAGTIDSWLLYRLTNGTVHLTDLTNAGRFQWPVWREISRRRFSGRCARDRVWPRTPMAPGVSCSCTPGNNRSPALAAC